MKKIIFIYALIIGLFFISCYDSKTNKSDDTKKEEYMNENIQQTFFGATFGDSKESVIQKFSDHGLRNVNLLSTDLILQFTSDEGLYFSFGDMPWENLNVLIKNDIFYGIVFYTPVKEKETAMAFYNKILSAVSQKYKMKEETPEDSLTYVISKGYGNNNCHVSVQCVKYESLVHDIWYTAFLGYVNDSIKEETSDEL